MSGITDKGAMKDPEPIQNTEVDEERVRSLSPISFPKLQEIIHTSMTDFRTFDPASWERRRSQRRRRTIRPPESHICRESREWSQGVNIRQGQGYIPQTGPACRERPLAISYSKLEETAEFKAGIVCVVLALTSYLWTLEEPKNGLGRWVWQESRNNIQYIYDRELFEERADRPNRAYTSIINLSIVGSPIPWPIISRDIAGGSNVTSNNFHLCTWRCFVINSMILLDPC